MANTRISRIFLRISAILDIVVACVVLLCAIAMIVLGTLPAFHDLLVEHSQEMNMPGSVSPDKAADLVSIFLVSGGISLLFLVGTCVAGAIVAFKALETPTKNLLIANIVLGCFSVQLSIPGGILGLIGLSREKQ